MSILNPNDRPLGARRNEEDMSEIKVTKCDVCDERTDDSCDYRGWIRTTGRFSISKGRDKNKNAQSGYMGDAERDFCSRKCFLSWLDKL